MCLLKWNLFVRIQLLFFILLFVCYQFGCLLLFKSITSIEFPPSSMSSITWTKKQTVLSQVDFVISQVSILCKKILSHNWYKKLHSLESLQPVQKSVSRNLQTSAGSLKLIQQFEISKWYKNLLCLWYLKLVFCEKKIIT